MMMFISNSTDKSPPPFTITRHYYKGTNRTEQSLDVYEPHYTDSDNNDNNRPTIVLVMGSGWLGHQWWVYKCTNWWNASGAVTLARLGYQTISVRHAGGFFKVPPLPSSQTWRLFLLLPFLVGMVGCLAQVVVVNIPNDDPANEPVDEQWQQQELQQQLVLWKWMTLFFLAWIVLAWQGQGAAMLPDMIQDVADALQFIHDDLGHTKILLGGYSSGGHVVANLLSQRHFGKLEQKIPQTWIQGVFYLSGVLSLDSWLMNFVTLTVFGKWARDIPSPYTTTSSQQQEPYNRHWLPPPPHPWKHLVVGCRHETFGVPVLDATFCAKAYAEWLAEQQNVPAKNLLVDSNHWSVLNSHALSKALDEHLPWLWDADDKYTTSTKTLPGKSRTRDKQQQPSLESTASSSFGSSSSRSSSSSSSSRSRSDHVAH